MKALTLWEPWASLAVLGEKEYETRSWPTKYRGPLAIHAGKRIDTDVCKTRPIADVLIESGMILVSDFRLGHVIGIVDMVDCIEMTPEFIASVSDKERAFGDWRPGRFALKLANPRRIDPVPATGRQGLWNWGPERCLP